MIPIAFYAPLKGPDHPRPSGDRALARALLAALEDAGFGPELASDLRMLDLHGIAAFQDTLARQAQQQIAEIVGRGKAANWRLWLTYHNYYKAPDMLGPTVAKALGIPYVLVEATRAKKRLVGPWSNFAKAAEHATDSADLIFYFTHRDADALKRDAPVGQTLLHLPPFLKQRNLPPKGRADGPILAAGMMRPGDKLASYRLIAETLALMEGDWELDIAGDGAARADVEAQMRPFGKRVRFLGQLDAEGMQAAYDRARLLFWPGVNEAIGLIYLEAQAAGVPVLAQNRPGLRDVLMPGFYPEPGDGPEALAQRLQEMLQNPQDSDARRAYVAARHLLPAAAAKLRTILLPLTGILP